MRKLTKEQKLSVGGAFSPETGRSNDAVPEKEQVTAIVVRNGGKMIKVKSESY